MEKIIIHDADFGTLGYHKNYADVDFHGGDWLCRLPFDYIEVTYSGQVHVCCPLYNPAIIGNVLEHTVQEIWQDAKANLIRETILDGSFKYCNQFACPNIRQKSLIPRSDRSLARLHQKLSSDTPHKIALVIDRSCNLACPSCRRESQTQLSEAQQIQGKKIIRRVLNDVFAQPHQEPKILSMDGSGEIFSSQIYREIFATEPVFVNPDLWPNLRFSLKTNGVMMTEKIQRKHANLFRHVSDIAISVDAGCRDSYDRVRLGGDWDLLWRNIDYYYATQVDQPNTWVWNVVVQKNNYQSIPDLIRRAQDRYAQKLPKIYISPVLNWGTWSESEYLDHAVHIPTHPEYERYLEVMALPLVRDYLTQNWFGPAQRSNKDPTG
jgi:MoaA/NifB/PqqE/SkfB family radical SAM enzyme